MAIGRSAGRISRMLKPSGGAGMFGLAIAGGVGAGIAASNPFENASNLAMDAVMGDANADNVILGEDVGFGSVVNLPIPHPIQAIGSPQRAVAGGILGGIAGAKLGARRGSFASTAVGTTLGFWGGAAAGYASAGAGQIIGQGMQAYDLLHNPVAVENWQADNEIDKAALRVATTNSENGYTSYPYPHSTMPYRQGATRTGLAVDGSMVFGQYNLRR